MPDHLFVTSH